MGTTVAKVIEWMEALAPSELAGDWDNVGLHTGARDSWVESVLVALTLEPAVLREAEEQGAELIVLHHPAIFRPLRHVRSDDPTNKLLVRAIRSNIALFSAHTNFDAAPEGLNESLAERLGLESPQVLVPPGRSPAEVDCARDRTSGPGLGRIGKLPRALTVEELCRWVKARLGLRALRAVSGVGSAEASQAAPGGESPVSAARSRAEAAPAPPHADEPDAPDPVEARRAGEDGMPEAPDVRASRRLIERVAVIGGAGAGYWREALERGADALITGDVKYHEALDAAHSGLIVIDAGHFGTEQHFAEEVADYLRGRADKVGVLLDVVPSSRGRDPFRIV